MPAQTEHLLLSQLADQVGIVADYYDIAGTRHVTTAETKRAILTAMGFRVDSKDALTASLREWEERGWRQPCEPVLVIHEGQTGVQLVCCLALEDGEERRVQLQWDVYDEAGAAVQSGQVGPRLAPTEVRFLEGRRHVRVDLPVPEGLPLGYYDLRLRGEGLVGGGFAKVRLIVAPRHCYVPLIFQGQIRQVETTPER